MVAQVSRRSKIHAVAQGLSHREFRLDGGLSAKRPTAVSPRMGNHDARCECNAGDSKGSMSFGL